MFPKTEHKAHKEEMFSLLPCFRVHMNVPRSSYLPTEIP